MLSDDDEMTNNFFQQELQMQVYFNKVCDQPQPQKSFLFVQLVQWKRVQMYPICSNFSYRIHHHPQLTPVSHYIKNFRVFYPHFHFYGLAWLHECLLEGGTTLLFSLQQLCLCCVLSSSCVSKKGNFTTCYNQDENQRTQYPPKK